MAAPVGPDMLKIQLAPQVLLGAKTHVRGGKGSGAKRPRACLDDRQPFAAFTAAVGEDLAAANSGFTGKETDLAGALEAVRAECGLHTSE